MFQFDQRTCSKTHEHPTATLHLFFQQCDLLMQSRSQVLLCKFIPINPKKQIHFAANEAHCHLSSFQNRLILYLQQLQDFQASDHILKEVDN